MIPPEVLARAYASGLFPMAEAADDPQLVWVRPTTRMLIPLDHGFHMPRSLRKLARQTDYRYSLNEAFDAVLEGCAEREETWINAEIAASFKAAHRVGLTHSLEIWSAKGDLVGGLYGLALGGAFFGESMFSRATGASKLALCALVQHLRGLKFQLLDAQLENPHLLQFGAFTLTAPAFQVALDAALAAGHQSFPPLVHLPSLPPPTHLA